VVREGVVVEQTRVAWVIGAAAGIGAAIAKRFAADGWTLALTNEPGVPPTAPVPLAWTGDCDVRDPVAVSETYRRIVQEVGPVMAVSYNAGVNGPYEETMATPDEWRRTLDVNLLGAVWVAEAVAPDMMARGAGAIVFTASTNAHKPAPYMIPYRASKAALVMYMRSLALLLAPHGVRVNAVCPGVVLTPMQMRVNDERAIQSGRSPEDALAERRARIPAQAFVEADEVATVVALLVSGQVPSIVGQELVIDGGDVQYL